MRRAVVIVLGIASVATAYSQSATLLHDELTGNFDASYVTGLSQGQQVGQYTHWVDPWTSWQEPVLWTGTPESRVSLMPKGAVRGNAYGMHLGRQVGSISLDNVSNKATLWNGTATSTVDLHPDSLGGNSFSSSTAFGIHGDQQVGYAAGGASFAKAVLWSGTAASAELLHPAQFHSSRALYTDGNQQVGFGRLSQTGGTRALLWSGTAASAVDLTPASATFAQALGVADGEQVGYALIDDVRHAAVWQGTAESFVDLHPEGAISSRILATNGTWHVGSITVTRAPGQLDGEHAVVWHATTHQMIDLHQFLPQNFQMFPSWATSIDELGFVGGSANFVTTQVYEQRAVMWTVPEPSTFVVVGVALAALFLRRRKT